MTQLAIKIAHILAVADVYIYCTASSLMQEGPISLFDRVEILCQF